MHTIYVPTFTNSTQTFRIEQMLTAAVVQELRSRTNFHVVTTRRRHRGRYPRRELFTATSNRPPDLRFRRPDGISSSVVYSSALKSRWSAQRQSARGTIPTIIYREQYQIRNDGGSFFEERTRRLSGVATDFAQDAGQQHAGGLLMRSFAASDRFVADVQARKLAPGYVFVGDEAFFRKRCRDAILQHLVPADVRELSLYDMDLAEWTCSRSSTARARLR